MDTIRDRIDNGLCPICGREPEESKVIKDSKYGKIIVCKKHCVGEENE